MKIQGGTSWKHRNGKTYVITHLSRLEASLPPLAAFVGTILVSYHELGDPDVVHTRPISEWATEVDNPNGSEKRMHFELVRK